MDFITVLPTSNGKDALWVVVDGLTKMGHFIAYQGTMKPKDLADHFLQQIVRPHGLPNSIVSDRGILFTSNFWKQVTEVLGISHNLSMVFYLQTDGQTERPNAILKQYLRVYCNCQQDDWEKLLPIAKFYYISKKFENS
jgi:transposase InsO family protein